MKLTVLPILAGTSHEYFDPLLDALAGNGAKVVIRCGFAYVTMGGAQKLLSEVAENVDWEAAEKEFIVGIHHAISEPSAFKILRNVSKAKIRAYVPNNRLDAAAFDSTPLFHPKVVAVCGKNSGEIELIQAGSANLTISAVGKRPRNHEFVMACHREGKTNLDDKEVFESWWDQLWEEARVVNPAFIRRYAELRSSVLDKNPILQTANEAPQSIDSAEYLFLDVGAGSGPPGYRHQVEFPESLASFFGPPKRISRNLTLECGGTSWSGRPLSYKKTTYGVNIWRLGMPTQTSGGVPIAHRALRFKRTKTADKFEFDVVDVQSAEYLNWINTANLYGHLGSTSGNNARRYGFYSSNL